MRNTWMSAVAVITLALPLAACSGGGEETSGEIEVAVIAPYTGDLAYLGGSLLNPVQDYFDKVNDEGLVIDGQEVTLTAVRADDEANPEESVSVVKRLQTRDGIKFFIGPMSSSSASAVEPLMAADSDSTWLLSSAAVLGPTENENVFRNAATMSVYNEGAINHLTENPNLQRVGIVTDETWTAATQTTEDFFADVEASGAEIVVTDDIKRGDSDYRAVVTKFLAEDLDAVIFRGYAAEAVQFRVQARELGAAWEDIWTNKISSSDMAKLATDPSVNGVIDCHDPGLEEAAAAGDETAQAQLEEWEGEYSNLSDPSYDSAALLVAAMKKADSVDPAEVNAALAELTVDDVADEVLLDYQPQDDGLVFKDREVSINPICSVWTGTNWSVVTGL